MNFTAAACPVHDVKIHNIVSESNIQHPKLVSEDFTS